MLGPARGGVVVELKRTLRVECEIRLRLGGFLHSRDTDNSPNLRMESMRVKEDEATARKHECKPSKHAYRR